MNHVRLQLVIQSSSEDIEVSTVSMVGIRGVDDVPRDDCWTGLAAEPRARIDVTSTRLLRR